MNLPTEHAFVCPKGEIVIRVEYLPSGDLNSTSGDAGRAAKSNAPNFEVNVIPPFPAPVDAILESTEVNVT